MVAHEPVEQNVGASVVTLAEVLVRSIALGEEQGRVELLQEMEIHPLGVPGWRFVDLARVRASTGLKLPDCCVLLAAKQVKADAVASFDDRLRAAASDRGFALVPPA